MPNTNANPSIEQLENTISAYINSVYKDVPPTEEEFKEKADLIRVSTTAIMPVNDQEYDEILKRLKQTLVIQMDIGTYINDRNNGHQSWLPAKRADFDFFFVLRQILAKSQMKFWIFAAIQVRSSSLSRAWCSAMFSPARQQTTLQSATKQPIQDTESSLSSLVCRKTCVNKPRNVWTPNLLDEKVSIIWIRRRNRESKIPR